MKLTKKEEAWFVRLQKCLDAAPESLNEKVSSYTIGDADITVYDKVKLEAFLQNNRLHDENFYVCTNVEYAEARLYTLPIPFCVEATSG